MRVSASLAASFLSRSSNVPLAAQVGELMAAGAAKVYREKVSGAKANRAELLKVVNKLEPGDVLLVCRLDRLARSTRDLLNLLATISERGASFRSLRDTWADTTNAHGRLIITVLAGLAEFERELIRSRCGEGMERAKERGVRFGRPPKLTPHQRQEALKRQTQANIARSYAVDATTIGRNVFVIPTILGAEQLLRPVSAPR